MSVRALLKGVETRLRSSDLLNDAEGKISGIQANGRPPPGFGQIYYAVHWTGARAMTTATVVEPVDVEHGVSITITMRMGFAPKDRKGQVISSPLDLLDRAEYLASPGIIQGVYAELMNVANALIPGTAAYLSAAGLDPADATTNGFEEPLWLFDYGPVEEQGAAWIGAEKAAKGELYSVGVRFGHARRLQV